MSIMNVKIKRKDKMIILLRTLIKATRGIFRRVFLKEVHGMFLVGKKVQISHGEHIYCGRNVKFEDFSEIQGLCSEGLRFGDGVTISRGVMIRPSSYYGGDCGIGLTMGEHSSIGPYGYVGCSGRIIIGSNVMFGPKCSLLRKITYLLIRREVLRVREFNKKELLLRMIVGLEVM